MENIFFKSERNNVIVTFNNDVCVFKKSRHPYPTIRDCGLCFFRNINSIVCNKQLCYNDETKEHGYFNSILDIKIEWISIEEETPVITKLCDSDNKFHYSEYLLVKVENVKTPIAGYYCHFNDDQFFLY
jgi:hypothetical protein